MAAWIRQERLRPCPENGRFAAAHQHPIKPKPRSGTHPGRAIEERRAGFDTTSPVYRDYFDRALREVDGGHRALEAVGNPFAASALADTLFRFGPTGGTKLIQQALDRVMPGAVGIDGRMGPGTFGVYREFAANPATRERLLDELYGARAKFLKGREEDRNQHFRYLRQR